MLSGKTILVVEDAALIAVDIEIMLDELGAARIVAGGNGASCSPAQTAIAAGLDLAVLDLYTALNSRGDVLGDLDRAGVPAVFLTTGIEDDTLPQYKSGNAAVSKPFTYEDLSAAISRLVP